MNSLRLTCPRCGKGLRLRDPRLLGRHGQCPSCGERFVLESADKGELEQPPNESSPDLVATPATGTNSPDPATKPDAATNPAADDASDRPLFVELRDDRQPLEHWKRVSRRSRRHSRGGLVTVCVLATVAGAIVWGLIRGFQHADDPAPRVPATVAQGDDSSAGPDSLDNEPDSGQSAGGPRKAAVREPVKLLLMPAGSRIVVHLHPSAIWSGRGQAREFRECLGPLGRWAEARIRELALCEPADVEEITIGVLLDSPHAPGAVCALVRLKDEIDRSVLLERFQAERVDDWDVPVYVTSERAYIVRDSRTFAVAPRRLASEMVAARDAPNVTDGAIEAVLAETDRRHQLTIVLRPDDAARIHDSLTPRGAAVLFQRAVDWFRPRQVESVAWSLSVDGFQPPGVPHAPSPDPASLAAGESATSGQSAAAGGGHLRAGARLVSEIVARSRSDHRATDVARQLRRDLDDLPQSVLSLVSDMEPATQGRRRVIGRFPAMLEAVALSTTAVADDRIMRLSTVLPERAAPNLILALRLTWEELNRAELSRASTAPPPR